MSADAASGAIGVLGGAFNPPHLGHLALAEAARDQLGLDRVLLVVTGRAPHKLIEADPGPEVRLEMVRRACQDTEGLEASGLEVERAGESYTSETLEAISETNPGSRIWFICGSDIAATLPEWDRPEVLCRLAGLAVASRPGASLEGVESALESVGADPAESLRVLEFDPRDVSSTEVRRRCTEGERIDDLVPPAVAEMIEAEGLYA